MEFKLLTKNYKGIFISIHKFWKGVYFHFPTFTIRLFLWGIDWYSTKPILTTKWKKIELNAKTDDIQEEFDYTINYRFPTNIGETNEQK